ncbi:coiled-coil domain-containing protein [Holospora undulata]|uniref:Uncharacterized protein n=1 Tax=Holospora undulata HU1 TaxID=1321371 RepID=A0A061JIU2_9PROT|nr:hypothetical protein [Holospora undulata]ETZ05159.1 hypothetical protein K737_300413 [Holospora undulata HU1]
MMIKIFLFFIAITFLGLESLNAETQWNEKSGKSSEKDQNSFINELDDIVLKLENFISLKNKEQRILETTIQELRKDVENTNDLFGNLLENYEACTSYTEELETQFKAEQIKNSTDIHRIENTKNKIEEEKQKLISSLKQCKKNYEEALENQKMNSKDSSKNLRFSSDNFERFSQIATNYNQLKVELKKYMNLIQEEFPGFVYNQKRKGSLKDQLQKWKNSKKNS